MSCSHLGQTLDNRRGCKKQKQTKKNMELENASQVLNFLDWKIQNESISSTLIPTHMELLNTQFDCL